MDFKYLAICGLYLTTFVLPFVEGQTLTSETLKQESFCEKDNVTLSCDSDSIIALQNVQLGYNDTRCSQACCSFSIHDCFVNSTDIQAVKRNCSGQSTCLPRMSNDTEFCNITGTQASYLYFEYFCIPESRVTSVCSNTTVDSPTGEPLYLTNEGFPGETTGDGFCSCSFEAESCSADTTIVFIDVDLYRNTSDCLQQITFTDSNNSFLDNVGCESYNNDYINQKRFKTNYAKIHFVNNSVQNPEGTFIIGFQATEPNVTLRISCPTAQPTWCIDCGTLNQPTNGKVILVNPSATGYNATASVTCNPGFNASAPTITCKERGMWEEAICTPIACEPLPTIQNGSIQLDIPGNNSFGASANVTCDSGYTANTTRVNCTETGTWEAAVCISINCTASKWQCASGECINSTKLCNNNTDCVDNSDEFNCTGAETCNEGPVLCMFPNGSHFCKAEGEVCDCGTLSIVNGNVTLSQPGNTFSGAIATVVCNKGYDTSTPTVTCESDGLWTPANCNPKDCGDLPDVDEVNFTLTSAGNKTYGATATVACVTGYESSKAVISCLENATWETATCVIKDCGKPPAIDHGKLEPADNSVTTYGATAKVVCDDGYHTEQESVRCTEQSIWETVTCVINAQKVVIPPKEDKSVIVIVIVVLIIGLALLQVTFYVALHLKIYQQYTEPGDKTAINIALSAIPLLGMVVIAKSWKALRYRKYNEHPEDDRIHRNDLSTENGGPSSAGSDTKGFANPLFSDERNSDNMDNQKGDSAGSSEIHHDLIELTEKQTEGADTKNMESEGEQTDSKEDEVNEEKEKQTVGDDATNTESEGEQTGSKEDDVEKETVRQSEETDAIQIKKEEESSSNEPEIKARKEKQTEGAGAINTESEGEQTDSKEDEVQKETVQQSEETDAKQIGKEEQSSSNESEIKANEDQKPATE